MEKGAPQQGESTGLAWRREVAAESEIKKKRKKSAVEAWQRSAIGNDREEVSKRRKKKNQRWDWCGRLPQKKCLLYFYLQNINGFIMIFYIFLIQIIH